jgi:hypothetical protein
MAREVGPKYEPSCMLCGKLMRGAFVWVATLHKLDSSLLHVEMRYLFVSVLQLSLSIAYHLFVYPPLLPYSLSITAG